MVTPYFCLTIQVFVIRKVTFYTYRTYCVLDSWLTLQLEKNYEQEKHEEEVFPQNSQKICPICNTCTVYCHNCNTLFVDFNWIVQSPNCHEKISNLTRWQLSWKHGFGQDCNWYLSQDMTLLIIWSPYWCNARKIFW